MHETESFNFGQPVNCKYSLARVKRWSKYSHLIELVFNVLHRLNFLHWTSANHSRWDCMGAGVETLDHLIVFVTWKSLVDIWRKLLDEEKESAVHTYWQPSLCRTTVLKNIFCTWKNLLYYHYYVIIVSCGHASSLG